MEQIDSQTKEIFDKSKEYYKKWILLYINHQTKFETFLNHYQVNPKSNFDISQMIAHSHMYSIFNQYQDIIMSYHYSLSAKEVEHQLNKEELHLEANDWKYYKKNFFIRNIINQIHSLLEYVAFMINKLSGYYFTKENCMSFSILDREIHGIEGEIKNFDKNDIKNIKQFIKKVYKDLNEEDKKNLFGDKDRYSWDIRHKSIHRYYLGIDELSALGNERKLTPEEKDRYKTDFDSVYNFSGKPEYTYDSLERTISKMITNIDKAFYDLFKIKIIKKVIVKIED